MPIFLFFKFLIQEIFIIKRLSFSILTGLYKFKRLDIYLPLPEHPQNRWFHYTSLSMINSL